MSRKIAVLIGVHRVDGLPQLSGVGSGLDGFEEWVMSQGFEAIRFDDLAKGSRVSLGEISDAVQGSIEAGDVDKLFVYFTGHGMIRGFCEEYWLLSRADEVGTEAVNVMLSQRMSYDCGFGHIAFFGDACRTPASEAFVHVNGGSLFHRTRIDRPGVEVDEFYAARFGDRAYEVPGDGLFSRCLISALRGDEPDAIRNVEDGEQPRAVVSRSLRPVLERTVRLAANAVDREQRPFCRPGSEWKPNVLSWIALRELPPAGEDPIPRGPASSPAPPSDVKSNSVNEEIEARFARRDAAELAELTSEYLTASIDGVVSTRSPARLKPVVMGVPVTRTVGRQSRRSWMRLEEIFGSREPEQVAGAVLLRFGSRPQVRWTGVARLPGYSCVVAVRPKAYPRLGVDFVAYLPFDRQLASNQKDGIAVLVAETSARVRLGRFDVEDFDNNKSLQSAVFEDLNPTLTVLMAYILSRAGRLQVIRDMIRQFDRLGRTVPFDLPLLAGFPASRIDAAIAPGFPMMTSGWALLEDLPAGQEVLAAARRHLRPSMWTTFERPPSFVVKALAQPGLAQSVLLGV